MVSYIRPTHLTRKLVGMENLLLPSCKCDNMAMGLLDDLFTFDHPWECCESVLPLTGSGAWLRKSIGMNASDFFFCGLSLCKMFVRPLGEP